MPVHYPCPRRRSLMTQSDILQKFIDSAKVTISSRDGQHTVFDHKFPVYNIEGSPNAVGGIAIVATKIE
jgi:hypothetical protein